MGKLGVVIAAAGKGARMRTAESKQYLLLKGKPILVYALETFQQIAEVDSMVLVVGPEDVARCTEYKQQYSLSKITAIIAGGKERQHSVYMGLQALAADWVLVHDGVRPFVTVDKVLQCLREAQTTGAAVLAVPVKDTIKVVDSNGIVQSTPDRRSLWAIQTPQAFRLSDLKSAHEIAEEERYIGTDDCALLERAGRSVRIVEGDYNNIKITTPDDLRLAEYILSSRNTGQGEGSL